MSRRHLMAAAAAVTMASLASAASAATSSSIGPTGDAGPHGSTRVCASPVRGLAACHARVLTDARTGRAFATTSYQNGYTPAQLQTAYGVAPSTSTTLVAVVDAYANPHAAQDLAAYRTRFGLGRANLTQVGQTGGSIRSVGADEGWGEEEMLDLEMVSAMCPSCKILYVGADTAAMTDLAAAVGRARVMGAKVISNSYGGTEFPGEQTWSYSSAYNIPRVAVTVSTGDSGYGVQFPAAAQDVVAVGGTNLKLDSSGHRISETAWSGAGSGCSAYVGKPSWQKDAGCSRRTLADVAAVADPNTGVAVYASYGSTGGANWYVFGGTSVAAPLVAGIYGNVGVKTSPSGYVAPLAYSSSRNLFDVTFGNNGRCTTRKTSSLLYLCTAMTGYDGPTGNGTPNGRRLPF